MYGGWCGKRNLGNPPADGDDPWGTIIVVGHIFMPLMFMISLEAFMPFWAGVAVWAALFTALSLVLLPRSKGLFIALLWATRAPGVTNG